MQITFEPSSNWLVSAAFVPQVYFVELPKWIVFSAFSLQTPILESSLLTLMIMPCQRPRLGLAAVFARPLATALGGQLLPPRAPRTAARLQQFSSYPPSVARAGTPAFGLATILVGNATYMAGA
jgi:hypothetical protein